ncbi:MAG: hypothetical protein HKN11_08670, partial [Rhizobiales bacterium]|nr:hypothetical protein [Hyphomicrobiales bacterium]
WGITAAQLAASGITANVGVLEEPRGYIHIMNEDAAPGFTELAGSIGDPLAIDEVGICIKAYPSCNYTHRPIEAMLQLRDEVGDVSAIDAMSIKVPRSFYDVASRHAPQTPPQARFSITWCLAAAAVDGNVRIGHFEPEALQRADLCALESMIGVEPFEPPGGASDMVASVPDTLDIKLNSGKTLSATIGTVRGSPAWPMTTSEHQAKFADCLSAFAHENRSADIFNQLQSFDSDQPVDELLDCLSLDHQ